ncbi:MAG: peptidoglycan editing factor PgeF [Lachnospiraceae bacterium]|nr:peptidoglycan editing factor PgeF [Lachnospiraceae bacterium]
MISTTLCYIKNDKNEYLLLHRNKKENDLNEGKWIGVGGKFEEGETAEECLLREVFEETGLKLLKYHLHGVIKFVSDKWDDEDMYLYSATEYTGTLKNTSDEGDLLWVSADKILSLPTWEGDRLFLKPLLSGRDRIDMLLEYAGDRLVRSEDLTEEVETLTSSVISCPHGFSTRKGGVSEGMYSSLNLGMNRGDIRERVTENWRRFLESAGITQDTFVCGKQVHENKIHIADETDLRPAYGEGEMNVCDGYVTACKNVPLAIFIADCVPLLLEDKKAGVIGAVHCGWRGTVSDIEKNAIDAFISLGSDPKDIHAAIGPAIDKCCFEVGEEVIDAVYDLIGDAADGYYSRVRKKAPDEVSEALNDDKYMLDLRGVVKHRLIMCGLDPLNIETVGGCTMCDPGRYFSHRGTKGNRGSLSCVISMESL